MTDLVDQAQEIEAAERERALRAALRPKAPPSVTAMGQPCLDCGEPIAPARLRAKPDAVRCTECQGLREARAM